MITNKLFKRKYNDYKISFVDNDIKINIFVNEKLIAIDCNKLRTVFNYIYFSRKDLIEKTEKWKLFATYHLSDNIKNQIENFSKLLIFI